MKVLARFPALDAAAITIAGSAAVQAAAEPPAPAVIPTTTIEASSRRPRTPVRRQRSPFPGGSVVALAVLAGIVWTLASWNDARRAERSRAERLARMQSTFSSPGTLAR
jgi:hypothetical protein